MHTIKSCAMQTIDFLEFKLKTAFCPFHTHLLHIAMKTFITKKASLDTVWMDWIHHRHDLCT